MNEASNFEYGLRRAFDRLEYCADEADYVAPHVTDAGKSVAHLIKAAALSLLAQTELSPPEL